jgi:hypothetical protein
MKAGKIETPTQRYKRPEYRERHKTKHKINDSNSMIH